MKYRALIISLVALLLLGCILVAPRARPTVAPTPTAQQTAALPTPSAVPTSSLTLPPVPTSTPIPTIASQAVAALDPDWADLSPYRQAMRPAYAADVAQFADATRYAIDLDVDLDNASFQGTMRVRYTNGEDVPLDQVVFRLLPNTPGYGAAPGQSAALEVSAIAVDGAPVAAQRRLSGSALYLPLGAPLAPGDAVEIEMSFAGALPADPAAGYAQYGYIDGVLAMPNFYPLIPVYDDEGWNVELAPTYGDATFSDTALYLVRVTLPADVTLAASGVAVERRENDDGTVTTTFASGPMRDWTLVASRDYQTAQAEVDGVRVTSYYLGDEPGDADGGARALDYAVASLRIYEQLIGPYPFNELDVVATPTRAGGIEYPGLIVVAASLYDQVGGFFEFVIVHEVAHQWWYSLVGNDQLDEPWLDEALTQYTSMLYIERRYGAAASAAVRQNIFEGSYGSLEPEVRDMPVGLPVAAYPSNLYSPIVYSKGPLFFHEIRLLVGEDTFDRILQGYFEQFRYDVAYPQDLVDTIERLSGQQIDALYQEWVVGP
jgi:aminopeptidase N